MNQTGGQDHENKKPLADLALFVWLLLCAWIHPPATGVCQSAAGDAGCGLLYSRGIVAENRNKKKIIVDNPCIKRKCLLCEFKKKTNSKMTKMLNYVKPKLFFNV